MQVRLDDCKSNDLSEIELVYAKFDDCDSTD